MDKASCIKEDHKYTWSREATRTLIELYEGFPCLYEIASNDYYNKNKRTAAIEAITVEFNRRNLTLLSPKVIQEKIHGIRTQYLGEINKIKKSKVSGTGTDQVYKPKLWCFDILKFISKGAPVTKGESNMESSQLTFKESCAEELMSEPEIIFEGDIDNVENIIMSPVPSSGAVTDEEEHLSRATSRLSEQAPVRKRKRSVEKADKIETLMESAAQTLKYLSSEPSEPNSNVLFPQFIAAELNSIQDEDILDDLKQQIMNIIFNGKKMYRQKKNRL